MSLNSQNNRSSAITTGLMWRGILPVPNSSIGEGDRAIVLGMYSGIDYPEDVAALSVNPIEIQIRDGIAGLMTANISVINGYYYNIGSVNEWDNAKTTSWPRANIKLVEENNLDFDGQHPTNTHYTNRAIYNVRYEFRNTNGPNTQDRDLIAAKLAHDLKKFFGDYYLLKSFGCYQVRPIEYRMLHSADVSYPTGVDMTIEAEYYQQRETPTSG